MSTLELKPCIGCGKKKISFSSILFDGDVSYLCLGCTKSLFKYANSKLPAPQPCPFCGNEVILPGKMKDIMRRTRYFFSCVQCEARTRYTFKKASALRAWNRRGRGK